MAKLNVFTLENLTLYDNLLKQYINAGDAKAFKSAKFDEATRTLSLFKAENPAEGATADFTVEIPLQDLTALQDAIKANEDAIKAINNETTGILAQAKAYTDEEVKELADGTVKANADAIAKLDGDATVEGSVKAQIAAAKTELEGKITASEYDDTQVKADIEANKNAIDLLNDAATVEGSVDYKIAQAVAAIMENPDDTMNSINELVTWINDHAQDALELSNKVTANEGAIADLEALVGETGVAKQIEDAIAAALKIDGVDKYALASDLTAAIARIATLEGKAHTHTFDETVLNGITAEKVAAWDASEQNAKDYADGLNTTMDGRVKDLEDAIGAGGSVDSQIDAKIALLDAEVSSTEPEEGKGLKVKVSEVDGKLTSVELTGNFDNVYDKKGDAAQALADAKTYADGKDAAITAAQNAADKAQGEVDALETKVDGMYTNDQIDGFVADAKKAGTDAQAEVDALELVVADMYTNDDIDTAVADAKKAGTDAQTAVDTLAGKVGEVPEGKTVTQMIADAQTAATYDDTQIKADIKANTDAIEAHKTAIDNKVTTLVGEDTGKSVRTIANEELAAQLLSGEADADFETLQELAAWLEGHPEDVAAINLNIQNLQKLVGTLPEGATATDVVGYIAEAVAAEKSRAEGIEGGLETRLQAVETAVGEGGSVETQINNAIAELDADVTSAEVEEGKGVRVQVVEVDGVVTTVAVTGNYNNAYDEKGAAATAEANAKAEVTTLANGAVKDNTDAIAAINNADTGILKQAKDYVDGKDTAMDGRVDTLEGLVGDGYQAIPEADINALFA